MSLIQPRTLKGFRDLMPEQALLRAQMIRTIEDVFQAHGYGPIDTPVLEYAEILTGKGGGDTDKELMAFQDKGGREVALRFDLTVPLARYVAQHQGKLVFPFRRYHIGLAFRGERPQRGRAREFIQCDADLIGPVSDAADAETLVVLSAVYAALDVGTVTIRVSDRRILAGVMETIGAAAQTADIVRVLDKRDKMGDDVVRTEMAALGIAPASIERVLEICQVRASNETTLDALQAALAGSEIGTQGVEHLRRVAVLVDAAGVRPGAIRFDPTIARGLDYYTGIILEAQLDDLPEVGSVGSGGRYDDLAGLYTKTHLPGVGCSIGVTRLMDALEALGRAPSGGATSAAMIVHAEEEALPEAFAFAAALRAAGIASEVFPEARKHGQQMRYADRRHIPYVFTRDADGAWHGKRLADGETRRCASASEAAAWIHPAGTDPASSSPPSSPPPLQETP
jgi:histidyl-tRNA synthetase